MWDNAFERVSLYIFVERLSLPFAYTHGGFFHSPGAYFLKCRTCAMCSTRVNIFIGEDLVHVFFVTKRLPLLFPAVHDREVMPEPGLDDDH